METISRPGVPPGREALCWYCRHIFWDGGSPGYSEWTPGENSDIHCQKGHWKLTYYDDVAKFREKLQMAATCPDFEPSAEALRLNAPQIEKP